MDKTVTRGIVITTSEHTKDYLQACFNSVLDTYPILIVGNKYTPLDLIIPKNAKVKFAYNGWNGFELGGILAGKEVFDEFVHLMDTCVIKDKKVFERVFLERGHVFFTKGGFHYMGKFVSNDLPHIPRIHTKKEAIDLELKWLIPHGYTCFEPNLPVESNVFEEKFGQRRMRLENDFMIKWKGTWQ